MILKDCIHDAHHLDIDLAQGIKIILDLFSLCRSMEKLGIIALRFSVSTTTSFRNIALKKGIIFLFVVDFFQSQS
jgi:hypothetical protein